MANSAAAGVDFSQPKVGALIRARRRQLHMTLEEICQAAGISKGYLSQVERDHATPSLGTLAQIARSLDVGVDYFISTPSMEDGLTRSAERNRFSVDGSSIIYERIAADFTGNVLSSFVLNVPPGYRSETVSHEGEEILFILEGSITQRLDAGHVCNALCRGAHLPARVVAPAKQRAIRAQRASRGAIRAHVRHAARDRWLGRGTARARRATTRVRRATTRVGSCAAAVRCRLGHGTTATSK